LAQSAPSATTEAATVVGTSSATLNGTVNANGSSTAVTFEYGLTTNYGTTETADQSPVTGNTNTAVSTTVSGLSPNTTYHFRVVATNANGTSYGIDMTFTTAEIIPIEVTIDIKPGSDPNSINLGSHGMIPVAILTNEGFDAAIVDAETVRFGPGDAEAIHYAMEDVDSDGNLDMILHFRTEEVGLTEETSEATLTGQTSDGINFVGEDSVRILSPKGKPKVNANPDAPGQTKEPGEPANGKANGKDDAPGQNKEPGEPADGKANGKDDAPGQIK